jgi:multiple sugar transport system permease protein
MKRSTSSIVKHGIKKLLLWCAVIVTSCWFAFPFYWALTTSFKSKTDVFKPLFIPFLQFQPTLENWRMEAVLRGDVIMLGLRNSIIVATSSSILALFLGGMTAYALARFRFEKWKNRDILMWIVSLRAIPPVVMSIPFFIIFMNLGLIDNILSLIISYTIFLLPFSVLILRDAFREVPIEIEESAMIDGCGRFSAFTRISLPLIAPSVVAAFIICFAFAWNEFLFALVLTYKKAVTIPIVIAGAEHSQGIDFWYICTRSIIAITPPVILVMIVQKWIVRGLTMGAVKR